MTRLKRQKNEAWEKVTAEELFDLAFRQNKIDSEIAEIYGVTPQQVSYKRNKFNLKFAYGSGAMRRLTFEHGIEALALTCNVDEECKQQCIGAATRYFQKFMG